MIVIVLLIIAAILAGLATFNIGHPRVNLFAAAVLAFVLSVLVPALGG